MTVSYVKLFIDYDSEVLSKLFPFHRVQIWHFDLKQFTLLVHWIEFMAFKQLSFHRSAIILGPWDCQWSGNADNTRIKFETIIFIQTTDLGKFNTLYWFLSWYHSLKISSWIPLSSSNTRIYRIMFLYATRSWFNLDHNSAIFLENIFLESVANHTSKV